MSNYNPSIKMYYYDSLPGSGIDESNRIVPVPRIKINPEYYYANDTIVGYTYNVELMGYATSIDRRKQQNSDSLGIDETLFSIQTIKNIFNRNNGILEVIDDEGTIFKGYGGIIRNISFNESSNLWINYSEYTIQIEFNEIQLSGCSGLGEFIACNAIPSGISDSPELIDMKNYKVKSFSDGWSFSVDDNAYNTYNEFKNEYINISYNISANGKHYLSDTSNGKLLPAWEQAKNFCQYRLHQQVNRLIGNALRSPHDSDDGCLNDGVLSTIFRDGEEVGALRELSGPYKIYNEKITCSTSESEGSFEANYSSILKRIVVDNENLCSYSGECIHTFTIAKNINDDGKQKNIQLSLQGNIQGLVAGGLITSSGIISFPKQGAIFVSDYSQPKKNKYENARILYDKIGNSKKLNDTFLQCLDINNAALGVSGACFDPSGVPITNNLNLTHNYIEGSINYSTSFDTNTSSKPSGVGYQTIDISVEDSVPVIAEFVVPGRSGGPIIQRLNTDTPKKLTISIQGSNPPSDCCNTPSGIVTSACESTPTFSGVPNINISGGILTQNQYTSSTDGSFSLTRSYIYCDNQ